MPRNLCSRVGIGYVSPCLSSNGLRAVLLVSVAVDGVLFQGGVSG